MCSRTAPPRSQRRCLPQGMSPLSGWAGTSTRGHPCHMEMLESSLTVSLQGCACAPHGRGWAAVFSGHQGLHSATVKQIFLSRSTAVCQIQSGKLGCSGPCSLEQDVGLPSFFWTTREAQGVVRAQSCLPEILSCPGYLLHLASVKQWSGCSVATFLHFGPVLLWQREGGRLQEPQQQRFVSHPQHQIPSFLHLCSVFFPC